MIGQFSGPYSPIRPAIQSKSSSYRELARIADSIISVALAVGPISRLLTRQMYLAIESRPAWDHTFLFSPALLEELKFWFCNIPPPHPPVDSSTVVFSDSSDAAFGGFSASLDGTVASGMFTTDDLGQSSTFREVKVIYYVLLSFVDHLKHNRVKIFTDNQSAARIVAVGSSKVHLQSVAKSIFRFCLSHGIALEAQSILRSLNERADLLSRFFDKDDWRVHPSMFQDAKWGPHTIDLFASYYNAQLPRFNSRFASPGCRGVDALVQDWSEENNWVCPPIGLVVDAVRLLSACSGRGTLIIPEWPSAYFWPFLRDAPSRFKSFVGEVFALPAIKDLILEGPGQRQIYQSHPSVFRGCPKFRMLMALRVDFG